MIATYYTEGLEGRIHPDCIHPLASILFEHQVYLSFPKTRSTKHGDFRYDGKRYRISVNADQNETAFLITLCHEIAHLTTWISYQNSVKPHGEEWKSAFRDLMLSLPLSDFLPQHVLIALLDHLQNPKSSSGSDPALAKAVNGTTGPILEDLMEGAAFRFRNVTYTKVETRRTKCKCQRVDTGEYYLIHKIVTVEIL